MLETKITCDACGKLIEGRNGYPINDYIIVGKIDIPMKHDGGIYAVAMKPKLDREYHFHNLYCLTKWKKIEETKEYMLTVQKEHGITIT